MSDDVNKLEGWEKLGWKKPDNLEGGVRQDNKMIEMIDNSAKKVEESLQQTSKLGEYVSDDKDPIEKKMVDSLGRNVIDYKNGTKVIQDTKNNTQEIFGNDGGWSRYSKESGEWKKIEEGKYTEVTSESGDKYTQVEHVKDGRPFKISRIYEHGKVVEEMLGDNQVKASDLQKMDMPPGEKLEEKKEKSIRNILPEEDLRKIMDERKITSEEMFVYMGKEGLTQKGKTWSEYTLEEKNKIVEGVLAGRTKTDELVKQKGEVIDQAVEKDAQGLPEIKEDKIKSEEAISEKITLKDEEKLPMDKGSVKLEETKKDTETDAGKVKEGNLKEMLGDLPKTEQKVEAANVTQSVKEEKFERVELSKEQENVLKTETDKKEITMDQAKKLISDPTEIPKDMKFEGSNWTDPWKMKVYNYLIEKNIDLKTWNSMNPDQQNVVVTEIINQKQAPVSGQATVVPEGGQKYYDNNGNEISKEQYNAIQQMVTNAKAGVEQEGVNKSTEILNQ